MAADATPIVLARIGTEDERVRISPATSEPYRGVCQLQVSTPVTNPPASHSVSGFLIRPPPGADYQLVLTAAHCLFNVRASPNGKWDSFFANVDIAPGRDGESTPFGTKRVTSSSFCVSRAFMASRAHNPRAKPPFDVAFIRLPNNTFDTSKLPGFAVGTMTPASGKLVGNAGYPKDKDPRGTEQWYSTGLLLDGEDACKADEEADPDHLFYTNDTYHGSSGSSMFVVDEEYGWRAVGIHNGATENGNSNAAAKITSRLVTLLAHASKAYRGPQAIDLFDTDSYNGHYVGPIDKLGGHVGYVDTRSVVCPPGKIVVGGNLRQKMNRLALELWAAHPDGFGLQRLASGIRTNDQYLSVKGGQNHIDTNLLEVTGRNWVIVGANLRKKLDRIALEVKIMQYGTTLTGHVKMDANDGHYFGVKDIYADTNQSTAVFTNMAACAMGLRKKGGNRVQLTIGYKFLELL